jgi:hypothetical protein
MMLKGGRRKGGMMRAYRNSLSVAALEHKLTANARRANANNLGEAWSRAELALSLKKRETRENKLGSAV